MKVARILEPIVGILAAFQGLVMGMIGIMTFSVTLEFHVQVLDNTVEVLSGLLFVAAGVLLIMNTYKQRRLHEVIAVGLLVIAFIFGILLRATIHSLSLQAGVTALLVSLILVLKSRKVGHNHYF